MIALLILWLAFSVAEAYEDSCYTVFVDHAPTFWPRLCTGLLVVRLAQGWPLTWDHASLALILVSVFWLVFDLSLNAFKGQYIGYIGTTAKLDRLLKPLKPATVLFLKVMLVIVAFYWYYFDTWSSG